MANQLRADRQHVRRQSEGRLAICALIVGVVGFYLLAGQPTLVRSLRLVAGLVVAIGLLWTSLSGQGFPGVRQRSYP
jgi:preprotein translocase subunit SecE